MNLVVGVLGPVETVESLFSLIRQVFFPFSSLFYRLITTPCCKGQNVENPNVVPMRRKKAKKMRFFCKNAAENVPSVDNFVVIGC